MARGEYEIVLAPTAPECTVDGVLNAYACTHCASLTQLYAIVALTTYALNNHGDYTVEHMIDDSKCFSCISEHQFWEGMANLLVGIAIANGYFDNAGAVLQAANCLTCTDPKHVKAIFLHEMCVYLSALYPNND